MLRALHDHVLIPLAIALLWALYAVGFGVGALTILLFIYTGGRL